MYLKNGWVLRGKILDNQLDKVKIETYDKNIFVFQTAEIDTIKQEKPVSNLNIRYKKKGFAHYTELGPLGATNRASNGTTTSAFSLQTVNGYRFSQWLFVGIGAGIDLYAVQNLIPVFISFRTDFTDKGHLIPFSFVEGGYAFNATINDTKEADFRGGSMFATGLGLKILFNNNSAFLFSIGYRYQEAIVFPVNIPNRLAIRAGFSF
ncbi:MAG: hypothetical protein H7Y04_13955 [Verrucomicrobia bacterium]|nr:hypothetical protein [Cytophagales bacterium]